MYEAICDARYSIVFIGHVPDERQMRELLERGIKVILLCRNYSQDLFGPFEEARLFFFHQYDGNEIFCVIDGDLSECRDRFDKVASLSPAFNKEQYLVEHAPIGRHLFVQAGAGTGKTYVMMDRMMFLFHMIPDIRLSEVCFITFTNEATGNMKEKLIGAFNERYKVIKDHEMRDKYLQAIEEIAQMNISTIHSFFRKMLIELGPLLGYGKNLSVRSFKEEKKNIIRDIIDEKYRERGGSVQKYMAITLHDMEKLAILCWNNFDMKGLSDKEIQDLDWGSEDGDKAAKVQDVLADIFKESDKRYRELKRKYDAISMDDIIRDLGNAVEKESVGDYIIQPYRYIFCDEFQDSDDVQIQSMAIMAKMFRASMFVVGDLKQSIYRFRGATDSAFDKLKNALDGGDTNRISYYPLKKNYRTSQDIIKKIQPIFDKWGDRLPDHIQLEPAKKFAGIFKVQIVKGYNAYARRTNREKLFVKTVNEVNDFEEIEVLVRYNSQLDEIRKWCEKYQIVCYIMERGTFYQSPAVLDFRRMLGSFLYPDVSMYQYEFLRSTYSDDIIGAEMLIGAEGDKERLDLLIHDKRPDWWFDARPRFRKEPVFTVLKDIVSENRPSVRYGRLQKARYLSEGLEEKKADEQATIGMRQYEADLEKLMLILFQRFGMDSASLLDLYSYLENMINTDKSEDRPLLSTGPQKKVVRAMTVHKAKGLQFENVIIPFMNAGFINDKQAIFD